MSRKMICASIILFNILLTQAAYAVDYAANIGFSSEYIYRGIPQKSSSASGGLDLQAGGFYAGTWGADVGDGIEIDYYGGYGFDAGNISFSIGGTLYTYTREFDDTYLELNLGAGWKFLSFDAAIGEYDNFAGPTLNYQFYSLTAAQNNFYAKIGMFADDFDGTYFEAGYGNTLRAGDTDLFDYAIVLIYSDSSLLGGESDTNLVFTVTRAFSF